MVARAVRAFYEGARWRSGTSYIPRTFQSAWQDYSKATRETLQSKSRYFARNNPVLNRLADIFETSVVGVGLLVDPASSDTAWNDIRATEWEKFERFPDLNSRQEFGTLIGLAARSWFIDGEAFLVLTKADDGRPRIQVIEADRVSTPKDRASDEGKSIIDGIEIDPSTFRPTGYWVKISGDKWTQYAASDVIHVFEPERPGQYRGIPFCASVLNLLDDLDAFHKLEMKAAIAAATVANIRTTASGELDPDELIETGGSVTKASSGQITSNLESLGGDTIVLAPNEKLEQFKTERPSIITREYWRYCTELVCVGCGIPYIMAFPDSMQGTVYRGALDSATQWFRARSSVMIGVVRRIYEWETKWEIDKNPILSSAPKDWYAVVIHPPRSPNVDVGYNSAATIAELAQGLTTYDAVYGPRGLSWRQQFRKLSEQRKLAIQLGLIQEPQKPTEPGATQ